MPTLDAQQLDPAAVDSPDTSSNSNNARDTGSNADDVASPDAATTSAETAHGKKRKAGPGGRGVANLTPEQLAKKRANDREAQRNIRERTKAQIESLERTIEQLRSQRPYQELQRVVREKEAIEAENADIKRRLATVLQLIQPIVGHSLDASDSNATSSRHSVSAPLPMVPMPLVPRGGIHHDQYMNPQAVEPLSASSTTYTMPWQAQNGSPDSSAPPPFAPRPRSPTGQPTLLGMASSIYRLTDSEQEALTLLRLGEPRHDTSTASRPPGSDLTPSAGRNRSISSFSTLSASDPSLALASHHYSDPSLPIHQRLPLNGGPTCTLDSIVLTFRADIEKRLRLGQNAAHVLGPDTPDWRYIRDPDSEPAGQAQHVGALSRFFGQVLSHRMFPDLQKPPEKVGSAYLLYTSMYWSLVRDAHSFDRIPPWLRPTEMQYATAHGPWIDAMFWPEMRDQVLRNLGEFRFDELFVPLTRTVSCNWPHGDEAIFDQMAMRAGRWLLSERFLKHIEKLENWTMGSEFAKAYPQLVGTYPLKESS